MRKQHTPRLRLGLVVALLLVGAFVFGPSASATQPECQVVNLAPKKTSYNSNSYANPLATAIIQAKAGDTLQVIGTCRGNFVLAKDLALTGRRASEHADAIDGNGSGTVLAISPGVTASVSDLVVTHGSQDTGSNVIGGGGILNRGGTLTLTRTTVVENVGQYGGGIFNGGFSGEPGTLTLTDSIVRDNTATVGGGGIANGVGPVTLLRSTVRGNSGSFFGGGIFNGSTFTITDSFVMDNRSDGSGGGIFSQGDPGGLLMLRNSIVRGNSAVEGGGISVGSGTPAKVLDSTVITNTAQQTGGGISVNTSTLELKQSNVTGNSSGLFGGGINNAGGAVALEDSTVEYNTASVWGGGIFDQGAFGGPSYSGVLTVTHSTVSSNSALAGGGMFIYGIGSATVTDSWVSGNTATLGGGAFNQGTLDVTHSLFTENTAGFGGGLFNTSTLTLTDSWISGNTATNSSGGGIYNDGQPVVLNGTNSLCGNTPDDWPGCSP